MSISEVATERIVAGAAATLTFNGFDQYGEPADPGDLTVHVTRADGDDLLAAGTATTGGPGLTRTVALTAAQTGQLDRLTAVWTTTSGDYTGTTTIDVVGGVYVSQAAADDVEPTLSTTAGTTAALFRYARAEVESMIEDHCKQAFVPRFTSEELRGEGGWELVVRYPNIRGVSWLRIEDTDITDLSDITWTPQGIIRRDAGWPCGYKIEIGYTHGTDTPPPDLRKAAIHAIRYQANMLKSGVTDRAISYQPVDGGNVVIATPGLRGFVTGIPAVDEVINRYVWRRPVVA